MVLKVALLGRQACARHPALGQQLDLDLANTLHEAHVGQLICQILGRALDDGSIAPLGSAVFAERFDLLLISIERIGVLLVIIVAAGDFKIQLARPAGVIR
ncbi:hypothetical protein [Halomonas halmophila]|uniref:hypothetical protein n=1 Tax=Halomonas halmophila TaxID=252 RepID=UPI0011430044|nr:hypothetical protein [Halomonas halmophila]